VLDSYRRLSGQWSQRQGLVLGVIEEDTGVAVSKVGLVFGVVKSGLVGVCGKGERVCHLGHDASKV
jgi:hypothetical protein